MRSAFKRFWQWVMIRLLRFVEWLSDKFSRRALLRIGTLAGMLGFRMSRRYRTVALKNLDIAYGDMMPYKEKLRITKQVFINFSKSAVEFPLAAKMSADEIRELVDFRPEDAAMLRELESRYGSFLGVSAHFGNFELMARRYVAEGFKVSVVVRNDPNEAVAEMINDFRIRTGYGVIPRGAAIRTVLKKMRGSEPETVVMLPDQKSDDVFVPFFGKLAGTVGGPAMIALRCGCPIVPVYCVRLPGDRHKLVFGDLIDSTPTGDIEYDIERIMAQINLAIEKIVRAYPEQWLWLHDRWKVQPPEEIERRWNSRFEVLPEAETTSI